MRRRREAGRQGLAAPGCAGVALVLGALGCGGGGGSADASRQAMEQAFARARAHGAPQAAPDLVDRAERARRDALQVSDREAKRLHQSAARTWLAAALAEAERLRWEDARLEAEARRAEAARRAAGARRALGRLAAEDRARARGRIVSGEIRRIAEPSGSGRRPPRPPDPVLLRAAEARWARARLTLAAARALGAEASVVDRLDGPLRRRPRESPSAALTRAEAFEDRPFSPPPAGIVRRPRPPGRPFGRPWSTRGSNRPGCLGGSPSPSPTAADPAAARSGFSGRSRPGTPGGRWWWSSSGLPGGAREGAPGPWFAGPSSPRG